MPRFSAHDGTELAYHQDGEGPALVCLPGGPQDSAYLGGLGGLSAYRRLVRLDLRGTGGSARPEDPASYRCDRLAGDVEELRVRLGLERMDLLAHSAGANVAALYAGRHPERVGRLVLVTPSTKAVGVEITGADRLSAARPRAGEPWFPAAFAALEAIVAGTATDRCWEAIAPFYYGRWDAAARAHHAAEAERTNQEAAAALGAEGAYDPAATRADLAAMERPVLLLSGGVDIAAPPRAMARFAALLPRHAGVAVLPAAGHFPWLDAPAAFTSIVAQFLH